MGREAGGGPREFEERMGQDGRMKCIYNGSEKDLPFEAD